MRVLDKAIMSPTASASNVYCAMRILRRNKRLMHRVFFSCVGSPLASAHFPASSWRELVAIARILTEVSILVQDRHCSCITAVDLLSLCYLLQCRTTGLFQSLTVCYCAAN